MTLLIKLIANNWRLVVGMLLVAGCMAFFKLWRHEVSVSAELRTKHEAFVQRVNDEGKKALEEKKKIEAEQDKTVLEISNAWNAQIQPAREAAVAAYIARYGDIRRNPPCGVLPRANATQGGLSGEAVRPERINGTGEEQVAVGKFFIQDCADDALKVGMWQTWAYENGLRIKSATKP